MAEPAIPNEPTANRRRSELGGSIYAIFFLLATNTVFPVFYLYRSPRLMSFARLEYFETWRTVIFVAELIVVILAYRLGSLKTTLGDMGLRIVARNANGVLNGIVWGLLAGGVACLISAPAVLKLDRYNSLAGIIIDNFYHPGIAWIVFLYGVLLPVAGEIVFRGILFKSFRESAGLVPALLLISAVFALAWPIYNLIAGFLLGLAAAFLYHKFGTVYPAIIANAVVTIGIAVTLVCARLYRFPHILMLSR